MSTRAQLSETISRLLPGEANKRIRTAILEAANYSGTRTDSLRQSIDQANRVRTGLLIQGATVFTSPTSATLSGFAWVIDFAVQQQDGDDVITVTAPDATYPREDWFVGLADGTIVYRSGSIDGLGNSTPPSYDTATEVVISRITRNPDNSNEEIPIPPPSNLIDFIEQNIIPFVRDGKLKNSGIQAILDETGAIIAFRFLVPVKGVQAVNDDEFVTKSQLSEGSKWTENEAGNIYRSSRVLVGNTAFSDSTAQFEVDGGLRANFLFYQGAANATITSSSTVSINMTGGNNTRRYILQANLTINFSANFPANIACTYTFIFRQDNTGGKTVTWNTTGVAVLWQGGIAPVIGTAANEMTVITIMWTGQEYLGMKSCGFNV